MAVTVTSQLNTESSCESTTGWTIHNRAGTVGSLSAIQASDEEAPPREGTYCLGFDVDIESGGYVYAITTADYSAKLLYVWIFSFTAANLDTKANGGIYVIARDSSANYGYWYVAGKDTYSGGWKCVVADLSRAPNANSGTAPNMANCTHIGIGFKSLAKSKLARNMFFDFMRSGNSGQGIQVLTTASSVATWEDVFSGDDTIAAGIIRKDGGVYFVQGPITFGDNTTGTCEFSDTSQLIVWEDADVPDGHYDLSVLGNSGGTTNFQLGTKSGARGISGCVFKTATATSRDYKITATDTDIDVFKMYGCSFINAAVVSLPTNTTSREVISCTFEECDEVLASTCIMTYCNFVSADDRGIKMSSTSHNITYCNFIDCTHGVHIDTAGTYTFTGLQFTGGDGSTKYDVENSSTPTVADSYSETNQSSTQRMDNIYDGFSQSFDGAAGTLTSATFYISKTGSPTGNAYAKLYSVSGGLPTGSALATSEPIAVSSLQTSLTLEQFKFLDGYALSSGTLNYAISIEYEDGDASNYVSIGWDISSPTHSGQGGYLLTSNGTWNTTTSDVCFYVRTGGLVTINAAGTPKSNVAYVDNTNGGTHAINNTVTHSLTGVEENTEVTYVKISDDSVLYHVENVPASGLVSYQYSYSGDISARIVIHHVSYDSLTLTPITLGSSDASIPIQQSVDRNYSNPT